jgi:predicted esterase
MAYRAASLSLHDCEGVIALGGDVPAEVEDPNARRIPRVLIGRGTSDDWYTESKFENDLAVLARIGSKVETCVFDGGHEWTEVFRETAGAFLAELL